MAAHNYPLKFNGIYGIPEVTRYLSVTPPLTNGHRLDSARLRYWIRTSVANTAPPIFPTRYRLVSFQDLVSMRLIAVLRSKNIKLQEIRITESWLREQFGIEWPLASRDLWTFGSDVFIQFSEKLIAASRFGHIAMDFLNDWLSKVDLDMTFDEDNIASSWTPYKDICLNPRIQFGEPCISGTRIPTRAIRSKVTAGDSLEVISMLYGVSIIQIRHATWWEERLVTT